MAGVVRGGVIRPPGTVTPVTVPVCKFPWGGTGGGGGGPTNTLLNDLVHWWEMDEASGTRADSHGSLDLTPDTSGGGGPMAGRNVIGGDGADIVNKNFLQASTPLNAEVGLDTAFTFATWAVGDVWESNFDTIFAIGRHGNPAQGFEKFWVYQRSGEVRVRYFSAGNWDMVALPSPATGTPFLLCGYYDQASGEIGISLDGSAWTTLSTTQGNINTFNSTLNTVTFGEWKATYNWSFDGGVARAGYWSRVLTNADLTDLYNGGSGLNYSDLGS